MNLIKYVGSKDKLVDIINTYIPEGTTSINETFAGSASVSLSSEGKYYYLSDASPELVNFLKCVRDNPRGTIRYIRRLLNSESETIKVTTKSDFYYQVRAEDRESGFFGSNKVKRAARYYFIIYHCFNGVYRVNQKGFCNIPFGGDNRKLPEDWEKRIMSSYSHMTDYCLSITEEQFDSEDLFQSVLTQKRDGYNPFVFIDAPYYGTFDMYTKEGTRNNFWERLSKYMDRLTKNGIPFLCTNSHCDFINDLFKDYKIDKIPVKYTVSRDGKRPTTFESFITNKELL